MASGSALVLLRMRPYGHSSPFAQCAVKIPRVSRALICFPSAPHSAAAGGDENGSDRGEALYEANASAEEDLGKSDGMNNHYNLTERERAIVFINYQTIFWDGCRCDFCFSWEFVD